MLGWGPRKEVRGGSCPNFLGVCEFPVAFTRAGHSLDWRPPLSRPHAKRPNFMAGAHKPQASVKLMRSSPVWSPGLPRPLESRELASKRACVPEVGARASCARLH